MKSRTFDIPLHRPESDAQEFISRDKKSITIFQICMYGQYGQYMTVFYEDIQQVITVTEPATRFNTLEA